MVVDPNTPDIDTILRTMCPPPPHLRGLIGCKLAYACVHAVIRSTLPEVSVLMHSHDTKSPLFAGCTNCITIMC